MKKQMSRRMKRMTGLYRWVLPVVFLYIIALSFFFCWNWHEAFGKHET